MELTRQQCYEALCSRDARFDGLFYTGVTSTGIYCRPVCPACTPKLENVRFFEHPAQAEAAGLRPCLRCRPETAPGSPAWQGTAASVSRALRLIAAEPGEDWNIECLAEELGMTSRHVRRLFQQHLGVSPVAVTQLYRVQLATRLLAETALPVTEVAFAAGFRSLRRFNAAMKRACGHAPRLLRPDSTRTQHNSSASALALTVKYRPPCDLGYLFAYLRGRAIPGVERIDDPGYCRLVRFGAVEGTVSVRPVPEKNELQILLTPGLAPALPQLVERVRRLFDLYCAPSAIAGHLGRDPLLAPLIAKHPGLRLPGAWDPFEMAVRAILGQQVSVKGATTLAGRLVQQYGTPAITGGTQGLTHHFPAPALLAEAGLESIGLPAARAACIRGFSAAIASGHLRIDAIQAGGALIAELCALPGIGPWTAHYIAMRCAGDPDAFPVDDLGLIKAIARVEGHTLRGKALIARAEAWRPWRAYAVQYLWASLADA
ncbi:MAG: DNA-3-methyladenine glycosylase 2 family protein [Candidatus Hydrogenedentes bacterium]|nr:DNA-3-methyladenine glycosylase 2 family protein [Candidatus Hydrogenedentota bacterium]